MGCQLCLRAQTEAHGCQIPAESIRQEEGLRQGYVPSIVQDSYGFMWFATKDGLHRYDGHQMHVFPENSPGKRSDEIFEDSDISYITCDSTGLLWIASAQKGLFVCDQRKARFYPVKGIKYARGLGFLEIRGHYLFVNSGSGWALFDIRDVWTQIQNQQESLQVMEIVSQKNLDSTDEQSVAGNYFCVRLLADYSIWMAGPAGLRCFANPLKDFRETFRMESKRVGMENQDIYHFFSIGGGDTLAFIGLSQVTLFNRKNNRLLSVLKFTPQSIVKESFYYNYPAQIDQHQILFCTKQGWMLLQTNTGQLFHLIAKNGDFSGRSRYLSRDGTLWVGTGGLGIYKLNLNARYFTIDSIDCFGFAEDDKHQLHVKFRSGTAIYNWKQQIKNKELPQAVIRTGIQQPKLWCSDSKGRLWYGGYAARERYPSTKTPRILMVSYSAQSDEAKLYRTLFSQDTYFSPSGYPSIFFDGSERFWQTSHQPDGQICFTLKKPFEENFQRQFILPQKWINEKGIYHITCHTETDSNTFWFGTNAGLLKLDLNKYIWTLLEQKKNDPLTLCGNAILSLWQDTRQAEILWVGTAGRGISRLNIHTLQCETFVGQKSLPNQVINSVVQDAAHHLWVSTNMGLCCLDSNNQQWITFTSADGLPGNEFNAGQSLRLTDGHLVFGGVDGITLFDPKNLLSHLPPAAKVLFTSMYVGNNKMEYPQDSSILKQPLELTEKMIVPHDKNFLRIEFALLDYNNPTKKKYRYYLKGGNSGWIDIGSNNQLVFSNLHAGSYELLVQGCASNGRWSPHLAKLQIEVLAPWYKQTWFVVCFSACGLLLIYFLYRYRLRQSLKLVLMRNAIASDLHDEIGSTISSISVYSDILQEKLNHEDDKGLAQRIGVSSREILNAMSDIVWSINPKHDRFDHVVLRMKSFALELLEPQQIQVVFDVDDSTLQLNLAMNQRKNFYLIFKEALHNAVKYSRATEVRISLQLHRSKLIFTLQDNGIGFNTAEIEEGNGLDNMRQRSKELKGELEIQSKKNEGTSVTLSFYVK